jgi:hypothetical protein
MSPERRENDMSIWDAIDKLTDALNATVIPGIVEIKTILIGVPGSNTGVCNQIKNLQESKADKIIFDGHLKSHKKEEATLWKIVGVFVGLSGIISAAVVYIAKKLFP